MRAIDKGGSPYKEIDEYQDAIPYLEKKIGLYCSYCEMSIKHVPEVEHKISRKNGGDWTAWSNLLLGCKYCNTRKAAKITPQNVGEYLWPDSDNTEQGEYSMFAGLLRCAECGGALTLKKTHTKDQHEVYTCSTYIHKGKAHCTQHRVDADDLYDAVLTRIQECAKAVTGEGTELEDRVKELCEEDTQGHRDSLEKLVSKQKDRLETLDRLIAKLYDDLINDKITESVFDKMLEKTQKEQANIKKELSQNESVLNTEEKLDAQSQQWIDDISEYADIKELDANLLNRLISKIIISEPQEKDGKENYRRTPETVTMEIHFNLKPIPELGTIERGSGSHK